MTGVQVDPERRTVRVAAGVLWQDVVEAAAAHGLAALHGSSPDVGVVGYSLGGGIGWYARQLGLATNSVTAVELVLGDGTQVRADEDGEGVASLSKRRGDSRHAVRPHREFWRADSHGKGNPTSPEEFQTDRMDVRWMQSGTHRPALADGQPRATGSRPCGC